MEAGYGAEEQVSRKARRLADMKAAQSASGRVDSEVEAAIAHAAEDKRRWAQGAEGERLVADALVPLQGYGWLAVHDVHWPGRPLANIDHIAIGPGGVFVIDAKNWSGDVVVRDGELRQNGYRQTGKADAAQQSALAVTALLAPQHRMAVAAVICLAAQDQEPVHAEPGVTVVGRHQLASMLSALPPRLTPFDVADLGRYLERELGGAKSPALLTTKTFDAAGSEREVARRKPPRSGRRDPSMQQPASSSGPARPRRSSQARKPRRRESLRFILLRLALTLGLLWGFVQLVPKLLLAMQP